jgi:hypothetical protein
MANLTQGTAVRLETKGILVSRATAALPATAAQNIFTVSGGRILLVHLVGEVTTIIQAQACTVKFTSTPTTGSAIDLSAASGSLSALEVGGKISMPSVAGSGNAAVSANAGYIAVGPVSPAVVAIGSISYTTSATNTGSIKWDLLYIPFDTGASVVAA